MDSCAGLCESVKLFLQPIKLPEMCIKISCYFSCYYDGLGGLVVSALGPVVQN